MAELLKAWCFKGAEKIVFFCFVGYLWRDLSELVSVIECDFGCSMETFYELCESQFCRWIGAKISGE